jgi:hypothetical protein
MEIFCSIDAENDSFTYKALPQEHGRKYCDAAIRGVFPKVSGAMRSSGGKSRSKLLKKITGSRKRRPGCLERQP